MLRQMLPEVTPALFGLVFVDGLLTFVSPCILPMLPIYLMYLSGTTGKRLTGLVLSEHHRVRFGVHCGVCDPGRHRVYLRQHGFCSELLAKSAG